MTSPCPPRLSPSSAPRKDGKCGWLGSAGVKSWDWEYKVGLAPALSQSARGWPTLLVRARAHTPPTSTPPPSRYHPPVSHLSISAVLHCARTQSACRIAKHQHPPYSHPRRRKSNRQPRVSSRRWRLLPVLVREAHMKPTTSPTPSPTPNPHRDPAQAHAIRLIPHPPPRRQTLSVGDAPHRQQSRPIISDIHRHRRLNRRDLHLSGPGLRLPSPLPRQPVPLAAILHLVQQNESQ